eukprot:749237-Pelagomonas_calceolata.AAC.3
MEKHIFFCEVSAIDTLLIVNNLLVKARQPLGHNHPHSGMPPNACHTRMTRDPSKTILDRSMSLSASQERPTIDAGCALSITSNQADNTRSKFAHTY